LTTEPLNLGLRISDCGFPAQVIDPQSAGRSGIIRAARDTFGSFACFSPVLTGDGAGSGYVAVSPGLTGKRGPKWSAMVASKLLKVRELALTCYREIKDSFKRLATDGFRCSDSR
jgi:hypothetical protein